MVTPLPFNEIYIQILVTSEPPFVKLPVTVKFVPIFSPFVGDVILITGGVLLIEAELCPLLELLVLNCNNKRY